MNRRIDMERHIPALIATLGGRIGLHAQRESARALGLDLREWRVLQILGEAEGRTVNEVADRIAMDRGGTSRSLARLEDRGLVARRGDAADRRRALVTLTPEGRALQDRVAAFATAREARLLEGFTPKEVEALRTMLQRLSGTAEEMLAAGWRPEGE